VCNILATSGVAAVFLLTFPMTARADDPAAVEAADANLESVEARRGMVFTLGVGGGFTFGLGLEDSTGQGGAGVLRVGRVASRRSVVGFELTGVANLSSVNIGPEDEPVKVRYRRDSTALLAFGQYYFGPVLWLRAGAGVGRYAGEELRSEVNIELRDRVRLAALVGSAGAGLDVVRLKRFRAGIEIITTGYLTRDGVLSANAFMLDFTID
jgi:hypothetical protein